MTRIFFFEIPALFSCEPEYLPSNTFLNSFNFILKTKKSSSKNAFSARKLVLHKKQKKNHKNLSVSPFFNNFGDCILGTTFAKGQIAQMSFVESNKNCMYFLKRHKLNLFA